MIWVFMCSDILTSCSETSHEAEWESHDSVTEKHKITSYTLISCHQQITWWVCMSCWSITTWSVCVWVTAVFNCWQAVMWSETLSTVYLTETPGCSRLHHVYYTGTDASFKLIDRSRHVLITSAVLLSYIHLARPAWAPSMYRRPDRRFALVIF